MANEIIRTSEVVATTEVTVCEICGHTGEFEDFLWCNPCNVVHCTHNQSCIEAHIHCNQEATKMSTFKITGFKHVTAKGIASLCCRMESEGTVSMLWDMTNKSIVDTLMGQKDWCMTSYLESIDAIDSDDNAIELHDELVDAKFGLMFAFCNDLDEVTMSTGRIISGLKEVTVADCWNPTSYYPRAEIIQFKTMDEIAGFCIENFSSESDIGEITVRVNADINPDDSSDGQEPQSFEYRITGAGDCNILTEIVDNLIGWGYACTFTRIN